MRNLTLSSICRSFALTSMFVATSCTESTPDFELPYPNDESPITEADAGGTPGNGSGSPDASPGGTGDDDAGRARADAGGATGDFDASNGPGDADAATGGGLDASTETDAGKQPGEDGGKPETDAGHVVLDAGHPEVDAGDGNVDSGAGESDAGTDPDPEPVRFIVFGDGGTGEAGQKKVAAMIRDVCAERGCQFALYLGDNIYNDGVTGPEDQQFVTKFEEPYAELGFPFYVALGNHDYGSGGSNIFPDDARSAAQVEYTEYSDKWFMPKFYYSVRRGPVEFFVLDTNAIVLDRFRDAAEQQDWLHEAMAASDAPWKIVMGHHPYISNGEHGNAGSYAGGPFGFELNNGATLRDLVEEEVCGDAQLYFSGHDHNREWLEPACGTTFIVSGAAAKIRAADGERAPTRWVDGTKLGFMWAEIVGDTFTGVFYDEDGVVNYEDTVAR